MGKTDRDVPFPPAAEVCADLKGATQTIRVIMSKRGPWDWDKIHSSLLLIDIIADALIAEKEKGDD